MKVNIGPYRPFWTTQNVERLWYKVRYGKYDWEVTAKDRDWLDNLVEGILGGWHNVINRPMNKVFQLFERKIKVKVHDYDLWDAHSSLAYVIQPVLKKFHEHLLDPEAVNGSPWTNDEDVPEHLRSTNAKPKENEYDADEFHFLRWEWIVGEMVWAFDQLVDEDNEQQFWSGESHLLWHDVDKDNNTIGEPYEFSAKRSKKEENNPSVVGALMLDGPNHTFKVDYDAQKIHNDRIKNGLRLFGVYFQNLWN